jgi:acyl carrier protein
MAAALDARDQRRRAQFGLGTISPERGCAALGAALALDTAQVAVLPLDLAAYARDVAGGSAPDLLADLLRDARRAGPAVASAPPAPAAPDLRRRLAEAPPSKQRGLVAAHVRQHVGRVLGLDAPQELDPRQPLIELGIDSLMAVELRNSLGGSLDQTLPVTLLFDHPTVEALVDYLMSDLLSRAAAGPPESEAADAADAARTQTVLELEALSDEEAERLLLAELNAGKNGH